MARTKIRATLCLVILSAGTLSSSFAQKSFAQTGPTTANNPGAAAEPVPHRPSLLPREEAGHASLSDADEPQPPALLKRDAQPRPIQRTGFYHAPFHQAGVLTHHAAPVPAPLYLPPNSAQITPTGYPSLNAPMYPVPLPNIPYQVGGTMITNQALDPHEMLYPHTYRSIYPPYYYEVSGGYKVFPWGVTQSERWRLRGTLVTVKYSSSICPFGCCCCGCSGFVPLHLK